MVSKTDKGHYLPSKLDETTRKVSNLLVEHWSTLGEYMSVKYYQGPGRPLALESTTACSIVDQVSLAAEKTIWVVSYLLQKRTRCQLQLKHIFNNERAGKV
jgi:hypothetical protein